MNCLECQEKLQKHLDGERLAAPEVDRHLSQCAACRDQHAAALRLLEGLKKIRRPALPNDFAATMARKVLLDRQHRQQKTRRRILVTMALAASVLLTMLLAYNWMPYAGPGPVQPKVDVAKAPPKDEIPIPKDSDAKPNRKEARTTLAALTERWADTTRDHAKVVLVAANLDGVENLPGVAELPMQTRMREASQEVSEGVRAVTRSTRRAFDFFARELPMPEMGEPKN